MSQLQLQGLSEGGVCRDRPQISRGYLEIRFKSRKMTASKQIRLDVRRLQYEGVAQEYIRELAENLGEPSDSNDPEKLWTDFKTKVLEVPVVCPRGTTGTSKSFLTKETLNIIEGRRRARLEGKNGQ